MFAPPRHCSSLSCAMLDNVDEVSPVAPSSTDKITSNAASPSVSVAAVPSNAPAASSSGAGPSNAHVATPTSSAADVMMALLFDIVRARAPVVSVVPPIVPSTQSHNARYTGIVIGNVNEAVGSELKEFPYSPELFMPHLDIRDLSR